MSIMSDRYQEYEEHDNESLYENKRKAMIDYILKYSIKRNRRDLASLDYDTLKGIKGNIVKRLKNEDINDVPKGPDFEDEFDEEYYEMLEEEMEKDRGKTL